MLAPVNTTTAISIRLRLNVIASVGSNVSGPMSKGAGAGVTTGVSAATGLGARLGAAVGICKIYYSSCLQA